jgi:HEAT repeat protein
LLLVFNTILAFHAVQLSYLFVLIVVVWIFVALALRRQYPQALAQALAKRRLGENSNLHPDRASLAVFQHALANPHARTVLYAANVLSELDPNALNDALPRLLAHPSTDVRRAALERIEQQHLTQALPAVANRLAVESSPELRGIALRTLARVGDTKERAQVAQALTDSSPLVRRGAIEGLLNSSAAAERALSDMARCSDVQERLIAAETLAELSPNGQLPLLLELLHDKNIQVQRAALRAIPKIASPELWEIAIADLSVPALRRAAMSALVAGQANVLSLLTSHNQLAAPDPHTRTQILTALVRLQYHSQDTARIHSQIRSEAAYAAQLCATIVDLGQDPALNLLNAALDAEIGQSRDRVFYLLSFLYDRAALLNARDNLNQAASDKRAYALEVLDVTLPHDLQPLVLPLVEGLTPAQGLTRLAPIFPQPHSSREERLREIISNPSSNQWLPATARYAASKFGIAVPAPQAEGGQAMISTIEKVLILKGVDIFAETPDDVLAEVAEACDELDATAGETIFNKGDLGDTLYVIVSGRVRVHDGAVTFNELGDAEVFGEMALLDPEPRSASVTATEETRLLRLAEQPFQELLDERPEIARSIIKVLTRRLRARTNDLAQAMQNKKG